MTIAHLLEDFGSAPLQDFSAELGESEGETELLASFEQGYKAGWDDAIKAKSEERGNLSADLGRNLQDLSFTYNEAYGAMTAALQPLMDQIVQAILPTIAQGTLGAHISEQLKDLAADQVGQGIQILVSTENRETVADLVEQQAGIAAEIVADAELGPGQAYVRFGDKERQIDLDEVLSGIKKAVAGFFHETEKGLKHG